MMQREGLTKGIYTGKRLLLVENSELNQEIVTLLLSYTGASVEAAADGQDAVEKFAGAVPGTYHMIFTELQLPETSGFEAACRIRSVDRPDAGQIPIIGLTGNLNEETIRAAEQAGITECLRTPLDTACLTRAMSRYLND